MENIFVWLEYFTLSRPVSTIKSRAFHRAFSDAVLLAEILSVYYPKLVEMHNYPPRNSHSLKLNNWMTLNKKVLKKLKLGLCCNTMEQLANCTPGVIERVLVMVRDKIRRDEEANRSAKEEATNISSGGSYYEACGDEDHVLVVPVKTRINGVLETLQQKVIRYEAYCSQKVELKDAVEANETLKRKVEHLENMIKLNEERINELQKQLERKQTRRKEIEALQNILSVPFETVPSPRVINDIKTPMKVLSLQSVDSRKNSEEQENKPEEIKDRLEESAARFVDSKVKFEECRIPVAKESTKTFPKPCLNDINSKVDADIGEKSMNTIDKEIKVVMLKELQPEEKSEASIDFEEFKDSEQNEVIIEDEIIKK